MTPPTHSDGADQLNLFGEPLDSDVLTEARVFEPAPPGGTCGWRHPQSRPDVQPCVRAENHDGPHVVWRAGKIDVVMWQVDETGGGRELFRGRVGGLGGRGTKGLTPGDVRTMYDTAMGFATELAELGDTEDAP